MAHCASTQAVPRMPKRSRHLSCATSVRWWAALACILATPLLLRHAPSSHPISEACVAVVGCGSGADWRAAVALTGAALAVDPAAPSFLAHRPARLPIGEAVSAIVWVSRRCRRRCGGHGRCGRDRGRAAHARGGAAILLLLLRPQVHPVHTRVAVEQCRRAQTR